VSMLTVLKLTAAVSGLLSRGHASGSNKDYVETLKGLCMFRMLLLVLLILGRLILETICFPCSVVPWQIVLWCPNIRMPVLWRFVLV
jgi:hypothetical protein